jgi:putative transcription factor
MQYCDLCGRESKLIDAIIEGSLVSVCNLCVKYGEIITLDKPSIKEEKFVKVKQKPIPKDNSIIEIVTENYAEKIKKARENLNLKQIELAKLIAEKESTIHHIESNHLKPSIDTARKLEQFLKIKLVEESKEEKKSSTINFKDEKLTIGDLLKLKNE